jgi:hypothetical protein
LRQLEGRTHRLGGTESAHKRRMTKRKAADTGSTSDIEKRMLAIADQVGRIAGTVQAKAEGWLDSDALSAQLSGVRDSATELLDQVGASKPIGAIKRGAQAALANRSSAGATAPLKGRPTITRSSKAAAAKGSKSAAKSSAIAKKPTKMGAASTSGAVGTRKSAARARSGGVVDAPGKKHRGPVPSESAATGTPRGEGSRLAKLKAAKMNRTQRRG